MKKIIPLFWLLILFSISTAFAIGVYDTSGDFNYFINNNKPTITINMSTPSLVVNLSYANITYSNKTQIETINKILLPKQNTTLTFNLNQELVEHERIYFKLYAYDTKAEEVLYQENQDPIKFYLEFDNSTPILLNPNQNISLTYQNTNLLFEFNEKLSKSTIDLNSERVLTQKINSNFVSDYPNKIQINLDKTKLQDGINYLVLNVSDIAENQISYKFNIYYRSEDLKLNLITKREDSNLKYNYDSNFLTFFNKTIYSSEESFTLKINTSKPSNCYYVDNLATFTYLDNITVENLVKFSQDSSLKTHTLLINGKAYPDGNLKKFLVACVNSNMNSDIAYLSDYLGISNSLISIKIYTNNSLDIIDYNPKNEITVNTFSSFANTNVRAICYFNLDSANYTQMTSSLNFMSHTFQNISALNGNHTIGFKCNDVLNNIIEKSYILNVDSNKGVKITSYTPKYSSNPQVTISLDLSEDAFCKYSTKIVSPDSFSNLTNMSGTLYKRNFTTSLIIGKNIFYIYCQNDLSPKPIEIYYDQTGPILSNLTFENGNIQSNYLGSYDEMNLNFQVQSIIPVAKYYVIITYSNSTEIKTISSTNARLNGKFQSAKEITIVGENLAGKNGSAIKKTILFDLDEPKVTFSNNNGKVIISCFDSTSGCYRTNYGLSATPLDCRAKTRYTPNSEITIGNNNYLCAESYDFVEHRGFNQEMIQSQNNNINNNIVNNNDNGNNKKKTNNTINLSNNTISNYENSNYDEENNFEDNEVSNTDEPWQSTDYDAEQSPQSTNYLLIAAIVLILVSVSGGSYYAYKKGYLNKELEKLGIKKKTINSSSSSNPNSNSNLNLGASTSKKESVEQGNVSLTKGKYEDHLNKLNSFVDETISKKRTMFDKFENAKTKEKIKLNNQTALTSKKTSKKTLTQDDIDDFYTSSQSSTKKLDGNDYKKDAENFEEYYQKKKKKDLEK